MNDEPAKLAPWLSVKDTAQRLFGDSKRSAEQRVVRLCQNGSLPHKKDGPRYWIPINGVLSVEAAPEINEVTSVEALPEIIEAVGDVATENPFKEANRAAREYAKMLRDVAVPGALSAEALPEIIEVVGDESPR